MKKGILLTIITMSFIVHVGYAQTRTNIDALEAFAEKKAIEYQKKKAYALEYALNNDIPVRYETDKTLFELQYIDESGKPIYYITHNANAASTISTNKVYPGGGAGFSLDGTGITVREWDGGAVRVTHQEYGGRVVMGDGASTTHYHATHVAGTIMAAGVDASAKGMAYNANLRAFDWTNDAAEMATEAANGCLLSNHSYGFGRGWTWNGSSYDWNGNSGVDPDEDYQFGRYNTYSQSYDVIAYNAPYYLICTSAGNDRNEGPSTSPPNDGAYDCIADYAISKNVLTVGAVNDISGGYSGTGSVTMSSFSSWGPADDGRIKPDVVANGVNLYSTDHDNNSDYLTISGTSMSCPSATGSLALLQQHYENLNGTDNYMRAASLKALAIHTADEAGSNVGPDYQFGWGLMNTETAVLKISEDEIGNVIDELTLTNGGTYTRDVLALGDEPLKVTICWTDPAHAPAPVELDPTDIMLVNDLDLRINGAKATYYPWKLNGSSPTAAATNSGENNVDNVEVVYIADPTASTYTITIDHDGSLSGGSQAFSIIISGINHLVAPMADFTADNILPLIDQTVNFTDNSANVPTSWAWSFNPSTVTFVGGTSAGSQNPEVQFNSNGAYTVTLNASNGYGNDDEIKTNYIHVGTPGKWTGSSDSVWSQTTNWENHQVPDASTDISITTAATWPTFTGDFTLGTNCNNLSMAGGSELMVTGDLTIASGKSLTCNAVTTIYVGGDWTNIGTFTPGSGTVEFNGLSTTDIITSVNSTGGGKLDSSGGGAYYTSPTYIIFDCTTAFDLVSVKVYASGSGNRTFYWATSDGTLQQQTTVNVPDGESRVSMNFNITTGTSHRLGVSSATPTLYRNNSGVVYPYSIGSFGSVTSSAAGSTYYYFCYDLEYETGLVKETFNNLMISKTNNLVTTSTNVDVATNLTISSGAHFTNASGNTLDVINDFILEANSTGTASFIDEGTTTVTGSTNVQYYCESNLWHYMSACFDPSGNHFDDLFTGAIPTALYRWDESHTEQSITGWWIDILNSNEWDNNSFVPGQGYAISDYTKGTIYSLSGDLYNTNQSINMTKTTGSNGEGWNLLGNPFPCSMAANSNTGTLDNFLTTNASVLDVSYVALYLYNDATEQYTTINNTSSATYISTGQGFLVRTAQNGNDISFQLDDRKHGAATFYKGGDETQRFLLSVKGPQNVIDETEIVFMEGVTKGLDPSYDAGKYKGNLELSVYTSLVENNNHDFAIQALPLLTEPVVVPVGFIAGKQGNYSITVDMQNFEPNTPVTLVDKYTSAQVDLTMNPQYSFVVDTPGTYNNRFLIYFKSAVGIGENVSITADLFEIYSIENQVLISPSNNIDEYSINIFNTMGQLILQEDFNGKSTEYINITPPGTYIVRVHAKQGIIIRKVLVR